MDYVPELRNHNGIYVASSRTIARGLGKRHDNIVRDIGKILISSNLRRLKNQTEDIEKWIIPHTYADSKNRNYKEYLLTKDGFTLYMFNIQGYQDFKIAYINKFNEMEKALKLPLIQTTTLIPVDKAKYWTKIKELSDTADRLRTEVYEKLKLLNKISMSITDEIDDLANIVFETENCINKIEEK